MPVADKDRVLCKPEYMNEANRAQKVLVFTLRTDSGEACLQRMLSRCIFSDRRIINTESQTGLEKRG